MVLMGEGERKNLILSLFFSLLRGLSFNYSHKQKLENLIQEILNKVNYWDDADND